MVNIGYGIGAGVIIRGTPLYGSLGMAGEFGHITFEKDSDAQCECGNFGCLEALASGNAIAKAARKELESGAESDLLKACDGDPSRLTAEMVAQSAKRGDRVARKVFDLAAEYIGVGIAGLINLVQSRSRLYRRRGGPGGGHSLRSRPKNGPGTGVEKDRGRRFHPSRDVRPEIGCHGGRIAHFEQCRQPQFRTHSRCREGLTWRR